MSFVYTTAIKKLRGLSKRIRVIPGGTSAGKTYGILPILIDTAIKNEGLEISVVSETIPHLRKGALKDFLKIMKETNRYIDAHYNRTLLTYTFANGSYIEFFSADQEGKVRGPRRTHLYINECNNISYETYHQLAIRTSHTIWLDFNPTHEFWAHQELFKDDDAEWLSLTYKDNDALPESIVRDIEKAKEKAFWNTELPFEQLYAEENIQNHYWSNWWRVYGEGNTGILDGVVFQDWSEVDSIPPDAKIKGRGMDFGYSNDPAAVVAVWYCDGNIYLDQEVYQTGLQNPELANLLKGMGITGKDLIYADSAEPKSIAELRSQGLYILPADKGPDSVRYGIASMQKQHLYVTRRSVDLIKELRNYVYQKDKEGNNTPKPIDAFNHAIDAARYYFLSDAKNTGVYRIR